MTASEWAKRMAQEFKAERARKAKEDAQLRQDQTNTRGFAAEFWAAVKGAFKAKTQIFNAAAGEPILTWEAGDANTFSLLRNDIEGRLKGSYQKAENQINIEVLGRRVPLHVLLEHRTGKYRLLDAGGKPTEPEGLAETLIEELLKKH